MNFLNNKKKVNRKLLGANTMKGLRHLLILVAMTMQVSAWAVNLTDVEFNSLPNGQVEMRFDFDGQVPDPKVYTIESPARIALDLANVSSQLKQKKHTLDLGNAQSVMVLESGRTYSCHC